LHCVAVCCSVLQCVAVCCSVLQCVAVCCSVLQCVALCCSMLQLQVLRHDEEMKTQKTSFQTAFLQIIQGHFGTHLEGSFVWCFRPLLAYIFSDCEACLLMKTCRCEC